MKILHLLPLLSMIHQTTSKSDINGVYNQTCLNSTQCSIENFLQCSNGYCRCVDPLNQIFDYNINQCVNLVDRDCDSTDINFAPKCITNSICTFGVCQCNIGFVLTPNYTCALDIDEPCVTDSDCNTVKGLVCSEGYCVCRPNSTLYYKPFVGCVVHDKKLNSTIKGFTNKLVVTMNRNESRRTGKNLNPRPPVSVKDSSQDQPDIMLKNDPSSQQVQQNPFSPLQMFANSYNPFPYYSPQQSVQNYDQLQEIQPQYTNNRYQAEGYQPNFDLWSRLNPFLELSSNQNDMPYFLKSLNQPKYDYNFGKESDTNAEMTHPFLSLFKTIPQQRQQQPEPEPENELLSDTVLNLLLPVTRYIDEKFTSIMTKILPQDNDFQQYQDNINWFNNYMNPINYDEQPQHDFDIFSETSNSKYESGVHFPLLDSNDDQMNDEVKIPLIIPIPIPIPFKRIPFIPFIG